MLSTSGRGSSSGDVAKHYVHIMGLGHGLYLGRLCGMVKWVSAYGLHNNEQVYLPVDLHTHIHPFNGSFFLGLPRWAGTREVKPIWILVKQEAMSGTGISWAICKSAPCSRQITTPAPHHSVFYRPDALPATQPTASKHWRHCLPVNWQKNKGKDKTKHSHTNRCYALPTVERYTEEQSLAGNIELFIHIINRCIFKLKYALQTVILKVIVVKIQPNKSKINGLAISILLISKHNSFRVLFATYESKTWLNVPSKYISNSICLIH